MKPKLFAFLVSSGTILVLMSFVLILPVSVHALAQNEITIFPQWSASKYYQGDSGSVTIRLTTISNDELRFKWIGIHIEWMQKDHYLSVDLSTNPISVPSKGSCTFPAIGFNIPSDAPVGYNEYPTVNVRIDYEQHQLSLWNKYTWISETYFSFIGDAYEKIFYTTKPIVDSKIGQATSAGFQGADAKSLLQQAINEKNLAEQLASQDKWPDAVTHLQTASNLVDQATAAENKYWKDEASTAISGAQSKINQVAILESSDAKTSLSQSKSKLTDAQNAYNRGDYKSGYQLAVSASSLVDQAIVAENNYWKGKASTAISGAQLKINQVVILENSDASLLSKLNQIGFPESSEVKNLVSQVNGKLTDARSAYDGGDYKTAYQLVTLAASLIDQATAAGKSYQAQKTSMFIVGGFGVAVIIGLVLLRRRRSSKKSSIVKQLFYY